MLRNASLLLIAVVVTGCDSTPEEGLPPFRHLDLYRDIQQCADSFTLVDGDWRDDFGDSAFWGLAYYAQAGTSEENQAYLDVAREVYQRNLALVQEADLATGDVNEIAMAALGLIEYMDATGDVAGLEDLDGLIADINGLVETLGHYLPPEVVPGYAMDTYGPVSINTLMALISLQRAYLLPGADTQALVDWASQVARQLDDRFWDGDCSCYRFGNDRPGLFLYPNVSMIILNARLYQLTSKLPYLTRARAAYQGIQPLKVTEESGLIGPGRYFSPYSAEVMGARTENYTTLSSQNFLMFSLMLLYQLTQEEVFLEEIDPVLDFIEGYLVGNACLSDIQDESCDPVCELDMACREESCYPEVCSCAVLHHWMDGRLAIPDDPEFFCSGCNFQLLYVMWYRHTRIE